MRGGDSKAVMEKHMSGFRGVARFCVGASNSVLHFLLFSLLHPPVMRNSSGATAIAGQTWAASLRTRVGANGDHTTTQQATHTYAPNTTTTIQPPFRTSTLPHTPHALGGPFIPSPDRVPNPYMNLGGVRTTLDRGNAVGNPGTSFPPPPFLTPVPAPVPGPVSAPAQIPSAQALKNIGGNGVPWYKTSAFAQVMLIVIVFFMAWLILAAIRPPFTRKTPDNKNDDSERQLLCNSFSAGKGAAYAAGAAVLCAIGILVLALLPTGSKLGK